MLHQHVRSRDSDVSELNPAIVDAVTTHLGTDIANIDTRAHLVGLRVPKLNHKALDAMAFSFDDQLSKDDSVRC